VIRVLMVDDEPSLLELSKDFMEMEGDFQVSVAESGSEAFEAVGRERFEVIVSDYMMPEMNGIQLLESLRERGEKIPFILFTGRGREEVVIDALNKGADFYLMKGGDPRSQFAELINMIQQAVSRRKAEEALEHNARRFRSLIENSSDIVCVIDSEGEIQYISPSVRRIYDRGYQDLLGTNFTTFTHPDDVPTIQDTISRVIDRPGSVEREELRIKDERGEWRVMEIDMTADPDAADSKIIINARDVTERRRIEDELRMERERYRTVFANTGSATAVIERDMTMSLVNDEFARLTSYSKEEIEGRMSSMDFIAEEDRPRLEEYHWMRRKDPNLSPRIYDYHLITKTGEIKKCQAFISVVPDTEQSILSVVDLTEIMKVKGELESRSEELVQVLDNIDVQVWYATDPETYGFANRARMEFLDLEREQIEGRKLWEINPREEEWRVCLQGNREAFEGREVTQEERVIDSNGEFTYQQVSKRPLFDEMGMVWRIVCTATDITGIKRAEEILREEHEQIISLLNNVDIPIYAADMDTYEVLFANKEIRDVFGEDIVGQSCYRAFRGRDSPCDPCGADAITTDEGLRESEFFIPMVNRYYQATDRAMRWVDGREIHIKVAFDITEQKEMEEALRMANDKLNLAVSVTRHDILNQLAIVRGYLDLIKMSIEGDTDPVYMTKIEDAVRNIENHLNITKEMEALGSEPSIWMRASEPVRRALSELDLGNLKVNIDDGLDSIWIFSDTMMWKVFYNLAHNTLRHAEGASTISVYPEMHGERMSIVYSDDGPGISEEVRPGLFQSTPAAGSGYGLYLVKNMLNMNMMDIMEEGTPGKGVMFLIDVPGDRFIKGSTAP